MSCRPSDLSRPTHSPTSLPKLLFKLFSISVRAQVPQRRRAVLLCPSAYPVPRVDFITEFQVRASEVPDETKLLLFLHPRCYFLSSGVVVWSLHYSVSLLTNVEASVFPPLSLSSTLFQFSF